MELRRHPRALWSLCHPALAALCLVVLRPQLHVLGFVGKVLLSLFVAFVLLFVVRKCIELASANDHPLAVTEFPLPAVRSQPALANTGDFNPGLPLLPFRYQLPPPSLTA
jgi:hypothetical protein